MQIKLFLFPNQFFCEKTMARNEIITQTSNIPGQKWSFPYVILPGGAGRIVVESPIGESPRTEAGEDDAGPLPCRVSPVPSHIRRIRIGHCRVMAPARNCMAEEGVILRIGPSSFRATEADYFLNRPSY